jgi:methionyl-tRNA formyltransferase
MRVLFAGSPAIAVPSLEVLTEEGRGYELAGVLTNPDSARGRHGRPEPTEAGAAAAVFSEERKRRNLPRPLVLKPEKLDARVREEIAALKPDILVSFAYGRIFGPKFLALFPMGGVNIHPSLLPKYRGPAPIPAVILNRDKETGITIQRLAPEMDCGDILIQQRFPLSGRETTAGLSELVARKSAAMLGPCLRALAGGQIQGRPQGSEGISYCSLLSKEDGRIDWSLAAVDIDARIRAFTPWPLSWTTQGEQSLYILEAVHWDGSEPDSANLRGGVPVPAPPERMSAEPGRVFGIDRERGILVQTGDGVLAVSRLQYRTKKALDWRTFLNGARDFTGSLLV